jgi:hypothetical protein
MVVAFPGKYSIRLISVETIMLYPYCPLQFKGQIPLQRSGWHRPVPMPDRQPDAAGYNRVFPTQPARRMKHTSRGASTLFSPC